MKNIIKITLFFVFIVGIESSEAQFLKKLQKRAEKAAEDAVIKKTEKKVYHETSKKMDTLLGNKKEPKKTSKERSENKPKKSSPSGDKNNSINQEVDIYRNYKFIPGEKVIFYDDQKLEEIGEFPSRWDLIKGGAEIARFNDEKVIITTDKYNNKIIPLFNSDNYLSDEFTIEFDVYVESSEASNYWTEIELTLSTEKMKSSYANIHLQFNDGKTTDGYVMSNDFPIENVSLGELNSWHHVAMSFYKGKLKLYYDEKRIANLPKANITPDQFGLSFRGYASGKNGKLNTAVKNIRIAHGGGQLYKRIVAEGKYSTNGILFDSGKSIIKPQSMGILNKIYSVLQQNMDWKFEIIGHTDSDGDTELNLTLSKERANSVRQALINKGISGTRLTTSGKGEAEPLNKNSSAEEKVNNRRVEFIMQK